MLVLPVVAAVVAGKAELEIRPGWKEPLNIYTVTVLPSGSRKTTVFRHATAPLYQYEKELQSRLAPEVARSQSKFKLLQQTCRHLRAKAAKEDQASEKKELEQRLEKTAIERSSYQPVRSPVLVVDDCSPEKLANLLAQQGGRLALLSAEGDIFELMAGRYSKGQPNFGVFLKGHSGDPLRVDRINRPTDEVPNPALTVGLTIQPDVLCSLTQKPGFRGRGLLARFLYSVPPSNIGTRLVGAPPVPPEIQSAFERKVLALAELFEPVETTHVLKLSPEASKTLGAFEEKVEGLLADGQELGELQDWGGKLVGAVARIAGILHFASRVGDEVPWACPVDKSTVVSAIRIGAYLKEHAQSAFQRMGADRAVEGAQKVLRWIEREEKSEFSKRDLHQALRGGFHRVEELDRPLRLLKEHGYIREIPGERGNRPGRPRSPEWQVNPWILTQNPQNTQKPEHNHNSEDFEDFEQVISVSQPGEGCYCSDEEEISATFFWDDGEHGELGSNDDAHGNEEIRTVRGVI